MGRPKLPAEFKAFKGTLNKTEENNYGKELTAVDKIKECPKVIYDADTVLRCPKVITDGYVKKFWKSLTSALVAIGVLSSVDVPEVEQLCITLQKLREANKYFMKLEPDDEEYDSFERRVNRLSTKFSELGAKYFISPAARSKLRLEDLNIQKTEKELEKASSPLDDILKRR